MDLLEASKEAIEKALYFRLADLLNLDVELILGLWELPCKRKCSSTLYSMFSISWPNKKPVFQPIPR